MLNDYYYFLFLLILEVGMSIAPAKTVRLGLGAEFILLFILFILVIPTFDFFVNFGCFVLFSLSASHWYHFFCSFSKKISKIKINEIFFHGKRLFKLSNYKLSQSVIFISVILIREYASEKHFAFIFEILFFLI